MRRNASTHCQREPQPRWLQVAGLVLGTHTVSALSKWNPVEAAPCCSALSWG